jgi:hypothetical protein
MKSLLPLYTRISSRLRYFVSAFVANMSFMLRYNSHTIRFALYMLPASEYSSDNLKEALQSLD